MSISELLEETSVRGEPRGAEEVLSAVRTEVKRADQRNQILFLGVTAAVGVVIVALLAPVFRSSSIDGVADGADNQREVSEIDAAHNGESHDGIAADDDPVDGNPVDDQHLEGSEAEASESGNTHSSDQAGSKPEGHMSSDHADASSYIAEPGCEFGDVLPAGQANPTTQAEPMGAIWCYDRGPAPEPTRVSEANSWIDDFSYGGDLRSFNDGDLDYRIFNQAGDNPPDRAEHWLNHNHWMVDSSGAFTGGSSMRPDRSFTFEDGTLVIEADVAADIPEYGNDNWVELTVTDAAEPNTVVDNLYAYGQFGVNHSIGCRLQLSAVPVCASYGPVGTTPTPGCSSNAVRSIEISFHQHCGETSGGGLWATDPLYPENRAEDFARSCEPNQSDIFCRDRFRMELTKDSLTLFVNGFKLFESKDWPSDKHLADSFISGEVYVYFSNWSWRSDGELVRYHWDRLAINPIGGPTSSPSFCLEEPAMTCADGGHG